MSKNLVGSSDINIVTNGDNISLELAQDYYNSTEVDGLLNNKVNTQTGKDLSTNDFTDALKNKLNGVESSAQVNVIEQIKLNGSALTPTSKSVNIDISGKQDVLTAGSNIQINNGTISATDTTYNPATSSANGLMSSTDKAKMDNIEANAQENKIESISVNGIEQTITDKKVNLMVENTTVYGIKRSLSTTSSQWTRTDDAVGLVANATHDGSAVQNDFDNIYPWSDIYTYNYDRTTGLETARIGDANFKFDGTNGEVLTKIPEFYYRRWRDTEYEYMQISKYPIDGFIKSKAFSVGRYNSYYDGTQIHSYSGYCPEVNRNITSFRTLSKAVGTNFGQLDWRYFLIQMLYLVEYADYNSQDKLGNGATGFRVNNADKALIAESSANRILLTTSNANNFDVGQQVSIGTATWNWSIAKNRTITSKEAYSNGNISGTMVYFDGDPVNIAVDNVLWTTGQKSGTCDGLGMKSGCYKTPKNACIYRGIENPFGNVYQFIDGINIKDYVAYICYDPEEYTVDKFNGKYSALGYTNANTSDKYATKLGYDEQNPLISLTTECVSGSNSTNMCDYYYCNSGNRIALVGGAFNNTTNAGLWCWILINTSSNAYYNIGSRLLRY